MSVKIELTRGYVAVVSDEDADLAELNWHAHVDPKSRTVYAVRNVRRPDGRKTAEKLHRVIAARMGIDAPEIDHEDGDGLNNLRSNLRPATVAQNRRNVGRHRDNTSGVAGVSWHKQRQRWRADVRGNGKQKFLGLFDCLWQAAAARDDAVRHWHGTAFGRFAMLQPGLSDRRLTLGEVRCECVDCKAMNSRVLDSLNDRADP